ncbi:nucleotidyltransferase family protein [Candidatus Bathyarchaeota archaeon]|nr:nucleotidyltransferase family protein [Candidatus Bathyarchaeota archaeon]
MISLVILAAGKSTRMKENKLLLKLDGETLIERVVKTAKGSSADEVIVVLGHEAEKVREQLVKLDCKVVVNENYMRGQSESVKVGLAAVASSAEAVMILPADVALIDAESINSVIDEHRKSKSHIVIASHKHQSGHPILLDRALFQEVSQIDESALGLKAVINRHRSEVKYVEVGTENVLIDIDTREEFDKYFRTLT